MQPVLSRLKQNIDPNFDSSKEIAHITETMYEQNLELAVQNKMLSTIRGIYEAIASTVGIKKTTDVLIETIVKELNFRGGAIALTNKQENTLKAISVFHNDTRTPEINQILALFETLAIPLDEKNNMALECVISGKTRLTNEMYDVVKPLVAEKIAKQMQEQLGVVSMLLFPILFGPERIGVLIVSLDKRVGDLSRVEREALREVAGLVGIAIDRALLYANLQDANEKLKALDKLKDDFVSVASHELRTPMTAIKSYLWMALSGRGGELSEKQKYYLDRSYSSTDRLIKLVNDMLNISRIESGRMTYDMEKVDMNQLVNDVITDVKPRSDELGITISSKIDDGGLSINPVLADPDKIKEVLFNVIGNSLKFTPKGGTIIVHLNTKDSMVICNVVDTGAGISKEDMEKLFQKFGLLAGSYTINKTDQQGTGLGLFITKSIIEKHGGTITAVSEGIGKGATFSFTLPIFDQQKYEEFHKAQEGKEKLGMIHTAVV